MKNSRLLQVFNTLSKKEVRELKKFLCSPYFNSRKEVSGLFDYLVNSLFDLGIIPGKEKAFWQIYPGKTYDPQQLRLVMSLLLKQIERYLVCKDFLEDVPGQKIRLARAYRMRQLPKHFRQSLRELQRFQEAQPYRNAEYYEDNYRIQFEQYQFTAAGQRIGEQNLQGISDNFDLAYISAKLRQTCLSLSHQAVYRAEYKFGLLEEVLHYIQEYQLAGIPAIGVYYYCYLALVQPGQESHFKTFKRLLLDLASLFPPEEIRDLYLLAINYCIKRLNAGHTSFAREGLDLYQEGLRKRTLLPNGVLSRFTYRNIVAMGLKVGDFSWVESFLHEYRNSLERQYRESMYSFCLARLEYSRENYYLALQLLQKTEYGDLLLNLSAKTLMMKIFYELGEIKLLEAHLEAMRTYLRRKKVLAYHGTTYSNTIKFTQKLLEIKPLDRESKEKLRAEIERSGALAEKAWLLQQAEKA